MAEISLLGEKYLDKQIENAITGVKEMKTVMEQTEEDHKRFQSELEKTKQQKEVRQEEDGQTDRIKYKLTLYRMY